MSTSDPANFADENVALAMMKIFSPFEIHDLEIADLLKQLSHEKKYELNSLLQSDYAPSSELGIEEYVAKIIIDTAKKKAAE